MTDPQAKLVQSSAVVASHPDGEASSLPINDTVASSDAVGRWLLLAFILVAFLRVTFLLDMKALWWDESLSLQRAEEALPDLMRGVLWINDGFSSLLTIDQHPFFSFLIQGVLIRLAGNEEYVLRYVSVAAATLMAPVLWVMARWFVRHAVVAPSTPLWAALLGAVNPFMLWYGQEARPYALWAMLAVLTTYLLLRSTEQPRLDRWHAAGFVAAELMFVTTHYYAVFILPIHAAIVFLWLARRSLSAAITAGLVLLGVGGVVGLYAAWVILGQGGGQNFPSITLQMLAPDLLNAFSLGLSVDLADVWWIDLGFAVLALLGAGWCLRSRRAISRGGWVLPAFALTPIVILLALNGIRPLYMNARHMSLLVGAFILLLAVGIGVIWQRSRWVGALIAIGLLAATSYSTFNYFTVEEYAKDDYVTLGEYMDGRIMPGDAVLFYPPFAWRIFEYYLPLGPVHDAIDQGVPMGIFGVPRVTGDWEDTAAWLSDLGHQYRRIWVIKSGTHPYMDLDGKVEAWLRDNFLQVRNAYFFSHSSLRSQLYLPEIPVYSETPDSVQQPVQVEFGNLIRLVGTTMETSVSADLPATLRLFWQVLERPARRYKYLFQLVERMPDGQEHVLSSVEREPYEGDIPTLYWDPGKTIMEWVEFPPVPSADRGGKLLYVLQMYDAETLEKLPVTYAQGAEIDPDAVRALLPYVEPEVYPSP